MCIHTGLYSRTSERLTVRALAAVPGDHRGWVAIQAFGYCHLLMLLEIITMAAGLKDAIGHAFDPLDLPHALLLSGLATAALTQLAVLLLMLAGSLLLETKVASPSRRQPRR